MTLAGSALGLPIAHPFVAGGVEDHPLDRRGGFFGYVDSFVYVYLATSAAPPIVKAKSVFVFLSGGCRRMSTGQPGRL